MIRSRVNARRIFDCNATCGINGWYETLWTDELADVFPKRRCLLFAKEARQTLFSVPYKMQVVVSLLCDNVSAGVTDAPARVYKPRGTLHGTKGNARRTTRKVVGVRTRFVVELHSKETSMILCWTAGFALGTSFKYSISLDEHLQSTSRSTSNGMLLAWRGIISNSWGFHWVLPE